MRHPPRALVDEVLAVGDEAFSHRCLRRIEGFLRRGKTLVLVSHSLSLIEELCDRALWLEGGRLRAEGLPRRVADAYRASVAEAEGLEAEPVLRVADGVATAFLLPAGAIQSPLVARYSPASTRKGLAFGAIGLVLALGLLLSRSSRV